MSSENCTPNPHDYSYTIRNSDGDVVYESKFYIALTEYGVRNYPRGMKGCRFFRVEYGGFNEGQLAETNIWLPPTADVFEVEQYLRDLWKEWEER